MQQLEALALRLTRSIGSVPSLLIHTLLFVGAFSLTFFGVSFERILLVVTTLLSLEAIYLSIFIQMSVNHTTRAIAEVEKDIGEIHDDVEEIQEDVENIEKDIEEIHDDVEEIQEDVEEMTEEHHPNQK